MVVSQLTLLVLLSIFSFQSTGHEAVEQLLKRGHAMEHAGEIEQALELWQQARSELNSPSTSIGAEYIRLVTEHSLTDYYPHAVDMYMWGLSDGAGSAWNRPALHEEMKRLEPILDDQEFRSWEWMYDSEDPGLLRVINTFWDLQNPLPGHPVNVRLLEHWQRIAYSRTEFTRRADPPYGTDARGRYYVQYGEPETRDIGQFHVDRPDVDKVTSRFFGEPITQELPRTNPYSSGRLMGGPMVGDLKKAVVIAASVMDLEYEVWRYEKMSDDMPYNLVLLFGESANGKYDRLETVEEMIPLNLFNDNTMSLFNPDPRFAVGFILQWLFYEQLSYKDPYFGNLFNNLVASSIIYGDSPPKRLGMDLKFDHQIRTRQYYGNITEEISTEEDKLPEIPVEVYQYRMLNEDDKPILVSFIESRPTVAFLYDRATRLQGRSADSIEAASDEPLENYRLMHGLRLGDTHGNLLAQSRYQTTITIDVDEDSPSWSVFSVPYLSAGAQQIFYAELENHDPHSSPRMESLFPPEIRGTGREIVQQPAWLEEAGEGFLLSDLVLGYQKEEEPLVETLFPFVVSNDRIIPENENLVIHFEVYRLQKDTSGISTFEISYDIRPVENILFWDSVSRNQEYSITLSFQSDSSRFSENLEIETQDLEPGDYELQWNARDVNSGRAVSQNTRFVVTGI